MERYCELDGDYRYLLRIPISEVGAKVLVIMLNPSTAHASRDDTTTLNLQKWARENNVATIAIVNLYAYRCPHPTSLATLSEAAAVGPGNMSAIARAVVDVDEVFVAWGNPPKSRQAEEFKRRIDDVLAIVRKVHEVVYCVGWTKSRHPWHPRFWYIAPERGKYPYGLIR